MLCGMYLIGSPPLTGLGLLHGEPFTMLYMFIYRVLTSILAPAEHSEKFTATVVLQYNVMYQILTCFLIGQTKYSRRTVADPARATNAGYRADIFAIP